MQDVVSMQSTETSEHLTNVCLKILEGVNTHEGDKDILKPYPLGGNHSLRARRGGKGRVSVPIEWKAAGNRVPNTRMTTLRQRHSEYCRVVSVSSS